MTWLPRLLLAGGTAAAYALAEARAYRLVERAVPAPEGTGETTILHVSDLHLRAAQRRMVSFLESLPDRLGAPPDLVVATGDLIEDDSGIDPVVEALGRLEARLGRYYVLGSHDLYRSSLSGVLGAWRLLFGLERNKNARRRNDVRALEDGLQDKGWTSLINSAHVAETPFGRILLCGTHDPYLGLHRLDHVRRGPEHALAIGVMHSPDVVSEFMLAGFDLVLAGHAHAGQVRVPLLGSIVTNCSLPNALSAGVHRVGGGWLHVSPGLGTGRFTPVRVLAPPEVTLLRVRPEKKRA